MADRRSYTSSKALHLELLRTDHVSMLCTGTLSYLGSIMEKERRVVLINDVYAIREHNYVLVCYIFI